MSSPWRQLEPARTIVPVAVTITAGTRGGPMETSKQRRQPADTQEFLAM